MNVVSMMNMLKLIFMVVLMHIIIIIVVTIIVMTVVIVIIVNITPMPTWPQVLPGLSRKPCLFATGLRSDLTDGQTLPMAHMSVHFARGMLCQHICVCV